MCNVQWLDATGNHWTGPNLIDYAAYLQSDSRMIDHNGKVKQQSLSASSVKSHLSTIRARYRAIMRQPGFKAQFKEAVKAMRPAIGKADLRAEYLDMLEDMQDAINPELVTVKTVTKQDVIDSDHLRLTKSQAQSLIEAPGIKALIGLRDTTLIYFMLSTGLWEAEIVALDVQDLRQTVNGELGVHVRDDKGAKERFVLYGELADCLTYIDAWLAQSNISEGAVFRGFRDKYTPQYMPGAKSPAIVYSRLTGRLNVRSINHILKQYPISIDGKLTTICPHDTRRTYAKLQYDNGLDMLAIRDNLGHADVKTTQGYIGDMNIDKRRGKRIIHTSHDRKHLQSLSDVKTMI